MDFDFTKSDRFDGDFGFGPAAAYEPTPPERIYVDRLKTLLDRLAAADVSIVDLKDELNFVRSQCAEYILKRARKLAAEQSGPTRDDLAAREVEASHRAEGIYLERRQRVLDIPFVVHTVPTEPERPIHDIEIRIRDVTIPEDKQRFKVEVDRTATVIKTVLGERRSWWRLQSGSADDPRIVEAKKRIDEYMFALVGIAKVGLMNLDKTQTPFASLALDGLKSEFVSREAGIVKNAYIARLGLAALVAITACAIGYVGSEFLPASWIPYRFREFFLLAAGSATGTWLSFSIRRVQLSFSDLALLEEDRLNPSFRIAFMVSLTTIVGLLLWTHAIVIEMGDFKSSFRHNGVFALLIGALSGIAERGLTTAVSKRAQDFIAGIGGSIRQ